MTAICGIYIWRNLKNQVVYIGQSMDCMARRRKHRHMLNNGTHFNSYLQRAWLKYGEDAFKFEVVVTCAVEQLTSEEQRVADTFREGGHVLYNSGQFVEANRRGVVLSEATRRKMALSKKGHVVSDQTRAKIRASLSGRKQSPEFVQKRVDAFKKARAILISG